MDIDVEVGAYTYKLEIPYPSASKTIVVNGKQYEKVKLITPPNIYSLSSEYFLPDTLYYSDKTGIIQFKRRGRVVLYAKGVY